MLLYQFKAPHRDWRPDSYDLFLPISLCRRRLTMTMHTAGSREYDGNRKPPQPPSMSRRRPGTEPAELHAVAVVWRSGPILDAERHLREELKYWKYQTYIKDYPRCVAGCAIGRVLDYLEDTGLDENTLVVYTRTGFTSATWLNDKRWWGVVKMPFVIHARVSSHREHPDAMAMNVDFAPTLLEFAGLDVPDEMGELQVGLDGGTWRRDSRWLPLLISSGTRSSHTMASNGSVQADALLLLHGRMGAV